MKKVFFYTLLCFLFSCSPDTELVEEVEVVGDRCPSQNFDFKSLERLFDYKRDYGNCNSLEISLTFREQANDFSNFNAVERINGKLMFAQCYISKIKGFKNLKVVDGDLIIAGCTTLTNIDFESLTTINGSLIIDYNKNLKSIDFTNLTEIKGDLIIKNNDGLEILSGFESLKEVKGSIIFDDQPETKEISGFNSLSKINDIQFNGPQRLEKISGFTNVKEIASEVYFSGNFVSLEGLYNIEKANGLYFSGENLNLENAFEKLKTVNWLSFRNDGGTKISGFNNLESASEISYSSELKTIEGFIKLRSLKKLTINSSLIENLPSFQSLTSLEQVLIHDNNALEKVDFLKNSSNLKRFELYKNPALTSIDAPDFNGSVLDLFKVQENDELTQVNGFEGITNVDDFILFRNKKLSNIPAFTSLKTAKKIRLENNAFQNLTGFSNLEQLDILTLTALSAKSLDAFNNLKIVTSELRLSLNNVEAFNAFNALTESGRIICSGFKIPSFTIFNNLEKVNSLFIHGFDDLTSLNGMNNLKDIKYLELNDNKNLLSVEGFQNVKSLEELKIIGNLALNNIQGFSNLETVSTLSLRYNTSLTNCSLDFLCDLNSSSVSIDQNGSGCNSLDEININCI